VTATRSDHMNGHATVKNQSFMSTAQIVESQFLSHATPRGPKFPALIHEQVAGHGDGSVHLSIDHRSSRRPPGRLR
jgi:hypothetical protein